MTSILETPPIIVLLALGLAAWIFWQFAVWLEGRTYRSYVRDWCLRKVKEDEVALTDAGIDIMVDYLWNKMKDRSDMWDCELCISPSVYRRIVNEYSKRKE